MSHYPVIYFNDVKEVSAGLSQQLQNYVKQGGTLVVFPSGEANLASYKNLLQPLNADYPEKAGYGKYKGFFHQPKKPAF